MTNFNSIYRDATIAIQDKGRLTKGSLTWLNENAGTDFPVTGEPFTRNPRREITDTATGITLLGFSNGDTMKAVCCGMADLAMCGEDKFREYDTIGRDFEPYTPFVLRRLGFAKSKLVFARSEGASDPITSVVTSYPRQTWEYLCRGEMLARVASNVLITRFNGGVEMVGRRNQSDIVDLTETGASSTSNGFTEMTTIGECEAIIVAAKVTDTGTYEWYNDRGCVENIKRGLRDSGNALTRNRPYQMGLWRDYGDWRC